MTGPLTPAEAAGPDGPPRALLIAGLVVAVITIGAVLGIAATRQAPVQPVVIASVPAPKADSPTCNALLDALPANLGEFHRVAAADPVPPGAAAWRVAADSDPVIMRCGIDRPAEFVVGSPIQMVNAVQWFRLDDPDTDRSTWVAVDRPVYVALTLPTRSGPTPIQTLSDLIARTMPAVPIDPNPAR
jgi:hypothetical protein